MSIRYNYTHLTSSSYSSPDHLLQKQDAYTGRRPTQSAVVKDKSCTKDFLVKNTAKIILENKKKIFTNLEFDKRIIKNPEIKPQKYKQKMRVYKAFWMFCADSYDDLLNKNSIDIQNFNNNNNNNIKNIRKNSKENENVNFLFNLLEKRCLEYKNTRLSNKLYSTTKYSANKENQQQNKIKKLTKKNSIVLLKINNNNINNNLNINKNNVEREGVVVLRLPANNLGNKKFKRGTAKY